MPETYDCQSAILGRYRYCILDKIMLAMTCVLCISVRVRQQADAATNRGDCRKGRNVGSALKEEIGLRAT